jgi:DNA-binding beta-propeller fold protein YncE
MATVKSAKSLNFEPLEGWAKLPDGWLFGDCVGVAVDSNDQVYVYCAGQHPVIVFDRNGNFLRTFGEDVIHGRHGISISPDDSIYLSDVRDHVIRKFSPEGKLLFTLGGESPRFSGHPFNRPAHMAVSPVSGDLFVADGYGNSRVHRYSPEGKLLYSWGEAGTGKGQFVVPHNVVVDNDEYVYIADRENHRLQVFDAKGKLQAIWDNIWRAAGLALDADGVMYVAQMSAPPYIQDAPGVGHSVTIFDKKGKELKRLGDPHLGEGPGQFLTPHGIAVDSHGDLYVAEVPKANLSPELVQGLLGQHKDGQRQELRTLQKLVRKK